MDNYDRPRQTAGEAGMNDYKRIATSSDVYSAIFATHADQLTVFGSYSAPDGNHMFGNPQQAEMKTEWGFKDSSIPIIGMRELWDVQSREQKHYEYWLCIPKNDPID